MFINKFVQTKITSSRPRKPYRKPRLEGLGDMRSLTLGGSIGTGESGSTVRKVKTGTFPMPGEVPQPPGMDPDGNY